LLEITNLLPDRLHQEFGEPIPSELIGSKLLAIGAPARWVGKDYLAVAIEYLPEGLSQSKHLLLAFHSEGMWILPSPLLESNLA
jgi:hypothetical protein